MENGQPLSVQIKGIRDGLLVTLHGESWPDLQSALVSQIESQPAFFQGGRLALDVGQHALKVLELSALRDLLSDRNVSLWAVLSESPVTEQTAQNLGLATRISKPRPEEARPVTEVREDTALWIRQTIRSGTRIEYPSHVVVMGDVNPGAEVISNGSVIVWGRLRGVVHAGVAGDQKAVVCALEFSPTQLRIAGEIAVAPRNEKKGKPEIARLKDGQLVVETWQ